MFSVFTIYNVNCDLIVFGVYCFVLYCFVYDTLCKIPKLFILLFFIYSCSNQEKHL